MTQIQKRTETISRRARKRKMETKCRGTVVLGSVSWASRGQKNRKSMRTRLGSLPLWGRKFARLALFCAQSVYQSLTTTSSSSSSSSSLTLFLFRHVSYPLSLPLLSPPHPPPLHLSSNFIFRLPTISPSSSSSVTDRESIK